MHYVVVIKVVEALVGFTLKSGVGIFVHYVEIIKVVGSVNFGQFVEFERSKAGRRKAFK